MRFGTGGDYLREMLRRLYGFMTIGRRFSESSDSTQENFRANYSVERQLNVVGSPGSTANAVNRRVNSSGAFFAVLTLV